jgi:hypothetical protein
MTTKDKILLVSKHISDGNILYKRYLHILSIAIDLPLSRNGLTLKEAVEKEFDPMLGALEQCNKWYDNNKSLVRTIMELDLQYYIEDNKLNFKEIFG